MDGREKFGTYFRDGVGQDYADQRYSSSMGGFFTADPGGIRTADAGNPVSWNRYVYVNGDPVNHTDRHGLLIDVFDCDFDFDSCGGEDASDYWDGCYGDEFYLMGVPDPGCPVGGGWGDPATTAQQPLFVSLRETSDCTEAHGAQTGNFTLEITYQVMVDGAAIASATQLYNDGIYFISEQLTNPTGTMGTSGANWCLGMASASCPSPGQVGSLLPNGTFVDELSGQGTLTQSFHLNGTGGPLQVAFGALGFVGPCSLTPC